MGELEPGGGPALQRPLEPEAASHRLNPPHRHQPGDRAVVEQCRGAVARRQAQGGEQAGEVPGRRVHGHAPWLLPVGVGDGHGRAGPDSSLVHVQRPQDTRPAIGVEGLLRRRLHRGDHVEVAPPKPPRPRSGRRQHRRPGAGIGASIPAVVLVTLEKRHERQQPGARRDVNDFAVARPGGAAAAAQRRLPGDTAGADAHDRGRRDVEPVQENGKLPPQVTFSLRSRARPGASRLPGDETSQAAGQLGVAAGSADAVEVGIDPEMHEVTPPALDRPLERRQRLGIAAEPAHDTGPVVVRLGTVRLELEQAVGHDRRLLVARRRVQIDELAQQPARVRLVRLELAPERVVDPPALVDRVHRPLRLDVAHRGPDGVGDHRGRKRRRQGGADECVGGSSRHRQAPRDRPRQVRSGLFDGPPAAAETFWQNLAPPDPKEADFVASLSAP